MLASLRASSSSSLRLGGSTSFVLLLHPPTQHVLLLPSPHAVPWRARGLTTTALGNLYEAHCLASLQRLLPGLSLDQVGGAGDRGVDLRGWVYPHKLYPSSTGPEQRIPLVETTSLDGSGQAAGPGAPASRVRVIVQCKATNRLKEKKLGPVILRELEGVMGRIERRSLDDEEEEEQSEGEFLEEQSQGTVEPQQDGSQTSTTSSSSSRSMTRSQSTLLAILCSSSGFSKQTMLQTTNQVEGNVMLVHLPLPEEVSRRLALEGLSDSLGEGEQSHRDASSSPSPPLPPSPVVTLEAGQPLSILLSSRLRSDGDGSIRTQRADPLSGRFSVGTRRSLQEGGGESPFLLWNGKELAGSK